MLKKIIVVVVLLMIVYFSIQVMLIYRSTGIKLQVQKEQKKLDNLKQEYNNSLKFLNELKKEAK